MQYQQRDFNDGMEAEAKRLGVNVYDTWHDLAKPSQSIAPYTEPETPATPPVFWNVEAKRTAFGTGCLIMIISAAQGAFVTVAPWILGGFAVVYVLPAAVRVLMSGFWQCFTWESGANERATQKPGSQNIIVTVNVGGTNANINQK